MYKKLFAFLILATLIGLGTWQVQRLHWKNHLLETIRAQMEKPPVPMPEDVADVAAWEYRRVTLAGKFLHDHEFLVKPRTLDGVAGYHMIVPFRRASGGIVMVNRGWISDALMAKASRPQGTVQVEGVIESPRKTSFTPENNPAKKDWYWTDTAAMAAAAGLQHVSAVVVAVAGREESVWPAGGKVGVAVANNHLQYAIFWYGMAVVFLVVCFLSRKRPAERGMY